MKTARFRCHICKSNGYKMNNSSHRGDRAFFRAELLSHTERDCYATEAEYLESELERQEDKSSELWLEDTAALRLSGEEWRASKKKEEDIKALMREYLNKAEGK